jgi:ribonuclease Z
MAEVILLGTGAALSDETREHMFMVVKGKQSSILIDCGGSPIQRLTKAGVKLDSIEHMILTHHHPDHMYGLSVFLLDLWLAKRKQVLHIYGLRETLHAAKAMMHAFRWERWRKFDFFPIEFHTIARHQHGPLFETTDFDVSFAFTKHILPSVATRIESKKSGGAMVYSSDTEVCDAVPALARGANLLFHEATTIAKPTKGHTTAVDAGAQAQRAEVDTLVLVHLPPYVDTQKLGAAARKHFRGTVKVGKDFARYEF